MNAERDIKVGLDCGDDRGELKPICGRAKARSEAIKEMAEDIFIIAGGSVEKCLELAEGLYELHYRK